MSTFIYQNNCQYDQWVCVLVNSCYNISNINCAAEMNKKKGFKVERKSGERETSIMGYKYKIDRGRMDGIESSEYFSHFSTQFQNSFFFFCLGYTTIFY